MSPLTRSQIGDDIGSIIANAIRNGSIKPAPLPKRKSPIRSADYRSISSTIAMRRLRAEKKGLDTSQFPPRTRGLKKKREAV